MQLSGTAERALDFFSNRKLGRLARVYRACNAFYVRRFWATGERSQHVHLVGQKLRVLRVTDDAGEWTEARKKDMGSPLDALFTVRKSKDKDNGGFVFTLGDGVTGRLPLGEVVVRFATMANGPRR